MNKAKAELESVFPTQFPLTIDGELIQTLDRGQVINPATDSVLADYPKASKHEFEAVIAAAKKAFGPWSRLTWGERQALVPALADLIGERREDFISLLTLEQGKPLAGAEWEIGGCIHWLREVAAQQLPESTHEYPDRKAS